MIKYIFMCALSLLATSATSAATDTAAIRVQNNLVSANFDARPLDHVLTTLAQASGIKVFYGGVPVTDPIAGHFDALPIDQALRQLLAHRNYTLTYSVAIPKRVTEVHIGTADAQGRLESTPEPVSAGTTQAAVQSAPLDHWKDAALHAQDPKARLQALKMLEKHGKDQDLQTTVAQTLHDKDPRVRRRTVRLIQRGAPVDESALTDLARSDADPKLRSLVWEELVDRSESPSLLSHHLTQAQQDQDPGIRAWATRKLQELADEAHAGINEAESGT